MSITRQNGVRLDAIVNLQPQMREERMRKYREIIALEESLIERIKLRIRYFFEFYVFK